MIGRKKNEEIKPATRWRWIWRTFVGAMLLATSIGIAMIYPDDTWRKWAAVAAIGAMALYDFWLGHGIRKRWLAGRGGAGEAPN